VTRTHGAVLIALAALASACAASPPAPAALNGAPSALHGAVAQQDQPRPAFTLVDTGGHPFDFTASTRGAVTLLYFGYTHCPDACPTAMADVAQALRLVPTSVRERIRVVFATTDPWRDTRSVLRHWLDGFHPPVPYVGLTGSPTQVAAAEVAVGMPISHRESAPGSSGAGKYAVDHLAAVLVYDREDRLATLYPSGVTPADIASDLQVLVKG
jgi:protein SCO1